ncbi:MAG: TerB family tellurite resistance protein [Bacteroidales bacterium]|nr:TerB family tellurite resistance protein [Bacteroidales bacterium]
MFSEQEKRTILQILTMIMEADAVIHPKEVEYINSLMNEFGLSSAEFDHMDMLDFDILKKEFGMMNKENQKLANEYFKNLAKIDGNIHNNEKKIIRELN